MALPKILSASALNQAIKTPSGLRIIDCTYRVGPKPDYKEFKDRWYGKFEELRARPSQHKQTFLNAHIPSAVHFDVDVGMYPSCYERFSIYEPPVFEKYAQLLGINNDDHLVFYGRGPFGGMLFSSRCFMLFRAYGHNRLSIVNGGFSAWQQQGFDVESSVGDEYPEVPKGNFKAKDEIDKYIVNFEEFTKEGGVLDKPDTANVFDNRVRAQFEGTQDTGLNPQFVSGTRIPGTKNVPSIEFFGADGLLKPLDQIRQELFKGYKSDKPTITFCNAGIQASLAAIVQEEIFPDSSVRVYNGSLKEMEIRAPERISEGPLHIN